MIDPRTVVALVADVLLALAAIGCFVFVICYHLFADWRASALGRNVMAFMAVSGILLSLGVVRAFVQPPDHAIEAVRAVAYGLVGWIVWRRVWLLLRYQTAGRRASGEERARHRVSSEPQDEDARVGLTPPGGVPRE